MHEGSGLDGCLLQGSSVFAIPLQTIASQLLRCVGQDVTFFRQSHVSETQDQVISGLAHNSLIGVILSLYLDASLKAWGEVLDARSVQGTVNTQAIWLSLNFGPLDCTVIQPRFSWTMP